MQEAEEVIEGGRGCELDRHLGLGTPAFLHGWAKSLYPLNTFKTHKHIKILQDLDCP